MTKERVRAPSLLMSSIPILSTVLLLGIGCGMLKFEPAPMMIIAAFVAGIIAWRHGWTWKDMQTGIVQKIADAMPAILILWSVGFLIGSWMFCGTVPMIIYYGVQIVNPKFLLVTAFLITAIVSTVTGTSWGAAGTVGVALMGIAGGLGVSLPATAGSVVAGAYFGDKISPLSDTTNLAPIAAGSELYEHIRHLLYTTIPATIVALIVYTFAGLNATGSVATPETVQALLDQLSQMFELNAILLLPVALIITGSLKKWPTIPTMLGTSLFSILLGFLIQGFSVRDGVTSLVEGFNVFMTGYEGGVSNDVTSLISRGGVMSVTKTTVLIFSAMGFAGIMSKSGMLETVLGALMHGVKRTSGVILATVVACVTTAFITGSSYLSILLPGEMFKETYPKRGLHPKNLSRTLEDSGTVVVPLIPWSAAGAFMAVTLGVDTMAYLPWAVLNYSGIVFAILWAYTGIGIARLEGESSS